MSFNLFESFKQFNDVIVALAGCVHCPDEVKVLPSVDHHVLHKVFNFGYQLPHLALGD